jgi:hypothetical protein
MGCFRTAVAHPTLKATWVKNLHKLGVPPAWACSLPVLSALGLLGWVEGPDYKPVSTTTQQRPLQVIYTTEASHGLQHLTCTIR